ncbi:DUF397 domain-containing protein [Streptomyces sp. NPDC001009]
MNRGLYSLPTEGAEVRQFCGGNQGGDNEQCVQFAQIPGAESAFVLTDSKPEGAGQEVRYSAAELDAFALGWAAERGLKL